MNKIMDHRIFETRSLLRLDDFLKMLPSVKPRKAREVIKSWQEDIFEQIIADTWSEEQKEQYEIVVSDNLTIQSSDLEHIFHGDELEAKRITPYGTQLICQAYKAGLFETKARLSEYIIPIEVQEYIDSTNVILSKQEADRARRQNSREHYENKISNLELICEDEFSYTLLNDVFVKKFDFKGNHHMLNIGGVDVTKSLSSYCSNSGLSSDWQVTFSWFGLDGEHKQLRKDSLYSGNRRNDSERNYGLHE
ncbi:hypothetical protein [Photobacterium carnosum]|uniref:hypothetical protein n=1 Tax=Photobacterium carnosum TaxID=2023717 RepID=UPI001E3569E5|nr:hypothetical protein [Photobacterium carnosum]MCD9527568.1 hypothetical protein [Photobacterium carnosum]